MLLQLLQQQNVAVSAEDHHSSLSLSPNAGASLLETRFHGPFP